MGITAGTSPVFFGFIGFGKAARSAARAENPDPGSAPPLLL